MRALDLVSDSRIPSSTMCGRAFSSSSIQKSNTVGINLAVCQRGNGNSKVNLFVRLAGALCHKEEVRCHEH
jgi:hypothetical protein